MMFPLLCFGQYTSIPDQVFEQVLIDKGYDNVIDGQVLTANISVITELYCSGSWITSGGIANLSGIEDFTALTTLNCQYNQLTSLDLSQNTALTDLRCFANQLTSLDVSNNTALTTLNCGVNQLTSLDVSNNTALTDLNCGANQLTSLDVSNNTALTDLDCYANQITSLDISQNTALTDLYCSANQLTSLDVSNNTALTYLVCQENQLTNIDVSQNTLLSDLRLMDNKITSLDVSLNPSLNRLDVDNNQFLSCLNMKNGNNSLLYTFYSIDCPNLNCIQVDDSVYSYANWINPLFKDFFLDSTQYFSENCNYPLGCFNINPNSVQEIPQSISLYPNPTNENITISIENFNGNIQTEVYDLLGHRLQSTNETTISLRDYARGIYLLKVAYGDRVEEVQVIKD